MSEESAAAERRLLSPGDPRQFGIIDLFAVMTLGALLCSAAAPFVRDMAPDSRHKLLFVALGQLAVTAASLIGAAYGRSRLLQQSGERIGLGYLGTFRWRHWPRFKSASGILLFGATQLMFALAFAGDPDAEVLAPSFILYSTQLAYCSGLALARYRWRVFPSTIEFFRNGISLGGTRFFAWEQVELRRSQFMADRVVIVIRQQPGSLAGDTRTAQVSEALYEQLVPRMK